MKEARNPTTIWLNDREVAALDRLAVEQDLSRGALMRQALRLYQLHHDRLKAGETITYSGDEQRLRDFAGPLLSEEA